MSEETTPCCCHGRTKHRDDKEERDLLNRLSRIEGQIRGIRGMVEKDAYCPDILTQVAAASAALNSFSKVLLASHIKTCVAQDIRAGKDETIDELLTTLQKLMRCRGGYVGTLGLCPKPRQKPEVSGLPSSASRHAAKPCGRCRELSSLLGFGATPQRRL